MATALQCDQAAFLARLSPTGARDHLAASVCSALRCAPASPNAGQERPESNVTLGIETWGRPASHGRRGFKKALLGSQANKVLAYGSIPVLICK